MTITAEELETWAAALESDEYRQGHGRLKDDDGGYCCLGVLCDLRAKDGEGEWGDEGHGPMFVRDEQRYTSMPPGAWLSSSMISALIEMNDNEKKSFDEIALWLRERTPEPA
jgi:hypothetical protein